VKTVAACSCKPTRNPLTEDRTVVSIADLEASLKNSPEADLAYRCPRQALAHAVSVIGGKWKALIVCELSRRNMRYHEIDDALSYVSHRVLTYELQALMKGGVVTRLQSRDELRAHRYSLTPRGRALYTIVQELVQWAGSDEEQAREA
jgi:DNA-binding HxlR family transcriptional regulator